MQTHMYIISVSKTKSLIMADRLVVCVCVREIQSNKVLLIWKLKQKYKNQAESVSVNILMQRQ